MQNRFLSNIAVLAVCVAGFFGITFLLNSFSYNEVEVQQEHSFERRNADKLYEQRNWEGAARYYKQLLASDPNNGGAAYKYAECIAQRRIPFLRKIYDLRRSGNLDEAAIAVAIAKVNEIGKEVIPAFEAASRFPRHRARACFQLARIHSLRGEKRKAIDYLAAALEDKFQPRYSISQYLEFQPILDEPEIRALNSF